MFDIAPSEFLLIALVAIVVIGPKDLPLALRTLGKWTAKMRAMSSHFRTGLDAMIREAELEEMERKWREQNAAIMAQSPGPHPDPHVDADGNTAIHAAATPALPAPDGEAPEHDEWTAQWSAHMPADDPAPPAATTEPAPAPQDAGARS